MRRKIFSVLFTLVLLVALLNVNIQPVSASTVSPAELISWMNSNRVANGYSPMVEDALLDQSAASAAYAIYASGTCDHPGGKLERIAATGYGVMGTFFATENMACYTNATLASFQNTTPGEGWGDAIHQLPATDAQYTRVGAYAYTAPNGITYYVMHAASAPSGGVSSSSSTGSSSAAVATPDTSNYVQPVVTATPDGNGNIYHVVQYGQSLYAIATWYGVTIETIKQLNSLTSDSIYEGQELLISIKPTPTITPTRTATVPQPTRTPAATKALPTPAPTVTATVTPKPSFSGMMASIDRQYLGLGLLAISAVGLLVVLFMFFLKPFSKK